MGLDFGDILRFGLASVERHRGLDEIRQADREGIRHAATVTKPGDADRAVAGRMFFQPKGGGDEVLYHLLRFAFLLEITAGFVGAGVAAERRQGIRGEGDESRHGHAAGDVFDVGIQAAVFMNDDDAGLLAIGFGGLGKQAAHFAAALGRFVFGVFRFDAGVVLGDLLRPRVIGTQGFQQGGGSQAAHGEFTGTVEEGAAGDLAMHIFIVEIQKFLVEIGSSLAVHGVQNTWGAAAFSRKWTASKSSTVSVQKSRWWHNWRTGC